MHDDPPAQEAGSTSHATVSKLQRPYAIRMTAAESLRLEYVDDIFIVAGTTAQIRGLARTRPKIHLHLIRARVVELHLHLHHRHDCSRRSAAHLNVALSSFVVAHVDPAAPLQGTSLTRSRNVRTRRSFHRRRSSVDGERARLGEGAQDRKGDQWECNPSFRVARTLQGTLLLWDDNGRVAGNALTGMRRENWGRLRRRYFTGIIPLGSSSGQGLSCQISSDTDAFCQGRA